MGVTSTRSLLPRPDHNRSQIRRVLIVGNYCHDVLIQNGVVIAETLGGAASFISNVLNSLSISCNPVSKVGENFKYSVNQPPIVVPGSKTTVFEAYFDLDQEGDGHHDRVLKRVCACDPIKSSDLPSERFDIGMAVGVGGEILPETLEKMIEICDSVFVDIQALIRVFDSVDGTVKLVSLKESGFYHLLPKIGFLKASSEEALFMDVEEVKKWCCLVVTNGKEGCKVFCDDDHDETLVLPFSAVQVDPTGAGDSFLGGFVAGFVEGLAVPDAALLGNFFGSLTVGQIGLPKFDSNIMQRVKDELKQRKTQSVNRIENGLKFIKPAGHEQFHVSLGAVRLLSASSMQDDYRDPPLSPGIGMQPKLLPDELIQNP